jgi:hypothetical protein
MSSQAGLSRRRVPNQSTSSTTLDDSNPSHDSRNGTTPTSPNHTNSQSHSHAGSAFRGGGGIAYDPRDLDTDEEDSKGGKLPRLTIMEEVLLLGLKDKQVRPTLYPPIFFFCGTEFRFGVTAVRNRSSFHVHHSTATAILTRDLCLLGIPFVLERQHIICPPRVHSHRTGATSPHRTRQGPQSAAPSHIRTLGRGLE